MTQSRRLVALLVPALLVAAGLPAACARQGAAKPAASANAKAPAKPAAKPGEYAPNVDHDAWAKLGYRLDWQGFPFLAGGNTARVTRIVPFDDMVLVQESSSAVALLEANTGAKRWAVDLANPITKFTGISRDPQDSARILVSSESELFGLAAQSGNLVIREKYEKVVNTAPVTIGHLAIYGCSTGEVQAHVVGRGVKAWGFDLQGSIDADPVRMGESVGAVSQAGEVVFLTDKGAVLGRNKIFQGLATNPVANDTTMYVAGLDQSVWAFDFTGALAWRYRTSVPLKDQPTLHADTLYVNVPGQGLTALNAADGHVRWISKSAAGTVIAVRNKQLIAWDGTSAYTIDPDRGDVYDKVELQNIQFIKLDAFDNGNAYAVDGRGVVSKFVPR